MEKFYSSLLIGKIDPWSKKMTQVSWLGSLTAPLYMDNFPINYIIEWRDKFISPKFSIFYFFFFLVGNKGHWVQNKTVSMLVEELEKIALLILENLQRIFRYLSLYKNTAWEKNSSQPNSQVALWAFGWFFYETV